MDRRHSLQLNRRDLLKLSGGILLGSVGALRPSWASAQAPAVAARMKLARTSRALKAR